VDLLALTPSRRHRGRRLLLAAAITAPLALGAGTATASEAADARAASVPAPTARLVSTPDQADSSYVVPLAIGCAVMGWAGLLEARRRGAFDR
jgi:hypothetical protein